MPLLQMGTFGEYLCFALRKSMELTPPPTPFTFLLNIHTHVEGFAQYYLSPFLAEFRFEYDIFIKISAF